MSKEGVERIKNYKLSNIEKKHNILPAMFGCKHNPQIIEFVNRHRNYFAIWAFGAMHIDHEKFK